MCGWQRFLYGCGCHFSYSICQCFCRASFCFFFFFGACRTLFFGIFPVLLWKDHMAWVGVGLRSTCCRTPQMRQRAAWVPTFLTLIFYPFCHSVGCDFSAFCWCFGVGMICDSTARRVLQDWLRVLTNSSIWWLAKPLLYVGNALCRPVPNVKQIWNSKQKRKNTEHTKPPRQVGKTPRWQIMPTAFNTFVLVHKLEQRWCFSLQPSKTVQGVDSMPQPRCDRSTLVRSCWRCNQALCFWWKERGFTGQPVEWWEFGVSSCWLCANLQWWIFLYLQELVDGAMAGWLTPLERTSFTLDRCAFLFQGAAQMLQDSFYALLWWVKNPSREVYTLMNENDDQWKPVDAPDSWIGCLMSGWKAACNFRVRGSRSKVSSQMIDGSPWQWSPTNLDILHYGL